MFIFAAEVIFDTLKPLGRKVWEGFFNTIKSIQQQISFDINGNPVWGLGLGISANPSTTLDEIFNYLNSAGKQFIHKYHLASSSSVVSAVRGLLEKDFIRQENNEYYVYDYFFQIWLGKRGYIN